MARTFQKFLQSKIDLSSVGLEFREDNAPYFVRPKDHLYLVGQCGRYPFLLYSELWKHGIFH